MPEQFAKTRISPSDLTFGWSGCKRCFYMRYAYGVSHQGPFPGIVMSLSSRQEQWYKTKHSHDFSPTLPSGVVHSTGKMLESTPIVVNGEVTPFTLGGKYDFLMAYDNGTSSSSLASTAFNCASPTATGSCASNKLAPRSASCPTIP